MRGRKTIVHPLLSNGLLPSLIVLCLTLITGCSHTSTFLHPKAHTPGPVPFTIPAYLTVPGNRHELASAKGAVIPWQRDERADSFIFEFGSGMRGFDSLRLDRAGNLTVVASDVDPEWPRYHRQHYRVPATQTAALLDHVILHRCAALRPHYTAGVNDGSQCYLHIDSNQRVRRFYFDNYNPTTLKKFCITLDAWLQKTESTRVGRRQHDDGFQMHKEAEGD
jgi:hypothetical protein